MSRPHRVPETTVKLGTVLDCTIADGDKRIRIDEWKGFQLLTDADAMERVRPRLYLVKGRLEGIDEEEAANVERAADTYRAWHKRDAAKVGELDTDPAPYCQGRMLVIGYRSDKWSRRGKAVDYEHDFLEEGGSAPLVFTNRATLPAATTVVVVGGSMKVAPGGIS